MRWALVIVILLLFTGCANGERKPHQQDAIDRIQRIFRYHEPPPIPASPVVVEPVVVPPAPVPKIEQPKTKPVVKPPKPEHKPKPKLVIVGPKPWFCKYGPANIKQYGSQYGYSSGQIAAAMRACGYS